MAPSWEYVSSATTFDDDEQTGPTHPPDTMRIASSPKRLG
jgi:hypothetical protein